MKYLYLILMLVLVKCGDVILYDKIPPSDLELYDIRTRLVINISGFPPGSRVYIRHWEDGKAYAYPSDYSLYIDAGGRILADVVLSLNTSSVSLLVYVDENNNGILDVADFGFYQADIIVDNVKKQTLVSIVSQPLTLTDYVSTATLPSAGQTACVYMPPGLTSYSTAMNTNIPEYPYRPPETVLAVADWFPLSLLDTTGVIQSVPLLSSWLTPAINESCTPL